MHSESSSIQRIYLAVWPLAVVVLGFILPFGSVFVILALLAAAWFLTTSDTITGSVKAAVAVLWLLGVSFLGYAQSAFMALGEAADTSAAEPAWTSGFLYAAVGAPLAFLAAALLLLLARPVRATTKAATVA